MKRKISSIIVVGILLFQSLSAYPFITEAKENEQNIETNTPSKEAKELTNSLKQTKTTLETGDTYASVFPDSALAKVIAKAATGSEDTTQLVTQEDLNKITSLSANSKGISELTGIDLLGNVTSISLNSNQITDISPINQLPNLVSLALKNNQINNITLNAQSQLPKITSIDLETNPNLEVMDIQDQPKLVDVKTSSNTGLRQLTTVIAKNNPELVNLGYYAMSNVYFSQVASLTKVELVNLPKVTKVILDRNSISELEIADLAIENLPLQGNELTDNVFDNLQNLPNLKTLDLSLNQLTEVKLDKTDVENLPNLVSLNMEGNSELTSINIQDQPKLVDVKTSSNTGLRQLTTVIAKNNPELVNLGYYAMSNVYFSQVASLTKVELVNLPKVTKVILDRNSISELEIADLAIENLPLQGNELTDNVFDNLQNLPNLKTLDLSLNQLTEVKLDKIDVENLPNLISLNMEGNSELTSINIQDQPKLVDVKTSSNTGLRQLTTVIAKNNPELVNLGYYAMSNVYFSQVASLTKVELVNLPKVTKVILDRNSISELEIADLAIENLPLQGNELTDNVFDNLQNLPNLKTLDLSLNQLTEVKLDKIDVENLPNLISLNMEGNSELTSINIQDQPKLVDVRTSSNTGLRQLTTVIAKNNPELVNLGYYAMSNVYFSQVASLTKVELVNLPKVTKVILDRNSISELNVTDLFIENLPVQGNKLTDNVFDNLQNLPNLKTLDLSLNQLTEVELDKTDVENLPNLVSLNMEGNSELTSINIQDQPKLVDVKTSSNTGLRQLTTVIAKNNPELVNLGYYAMRNVYFSQVASLTNVELVNLPKVRVVRLDRNSINQIELNNLEAVTEVNLNYNKITSDSIAEFENMPILATLNLNNNQITDINVLNDFSEITTLKIESNSIGVLPSNLKTKMPKLTTLSAINQVITLNKVITLDEEDLIINNEISNFGKLSQPIPISNSGTYANEKLTWSYERIKSLTEVNFQFSERVNATGIDGNFSGKVTQPFKRSTVPVINADTEIHYPLGTEKTEAAFLSEIHAQTSDDLAITSDFETMVNLKRVGIYTVTLNAENIDGIKAIPKEVTVYIDSVQGANITVKHEDKSGNKLAEDSVLSGNVGEAYNSSAKEIFGYILTEMPTNAQGEFSLEEQTVTYIYAKNPTPAKDITVQYTDEEGIEIATSDTLSGNMDEDYVTTAKTIIGYTLMETPSNATGKFTENDQIVRYTYRAIQADPILAKDVTVNYQDELGAEISESEVLTGEIGETYTTAAKIIEGYTLMETPTNADGIFTETPQTVTYVYRVENNPVAANITVKHLDESSNELAPTEVLSGKIGEAYTTKAKQLEGYSLVKEPSNASGNFTTEAQTVIYMYKKDAIQASKIIVKYEDITGKELATSSVLTGNIHDSYTTTPKEIKGYTLVLKPANASGKFMVEAQTIKYIYRANKDEVKLNVEIIGDNSNGDIQPPNNHQPTSSNQQILPRTGNQPLDMIFGLGIVLVFLSILWLRRNKSEKDKSNNCR